MAEEWAHSHVVWMGCFLHLKINWPFWVLNPIFPEQILRHVLLAGRCCYKTLPKCIYHYNVKEQRTEEINDLAVIHLKDTDNIINFQRKSWAGWDTIRLSSDWIMSSAINHSFLFSNSQLLFLRVYWKTQWFTLSWARETLHYIGDIFLKHEDVFRNAL